MAKRTGFKPCACHSELFAAPVGGFDGNAHGPVRISPNAGNGKAALHLVLMTVSCNDLGVYELYRVAVLDLNYRNAASDSDLRRSKSAAVREMQRFYHIVK